ncbi:DoxX family membrane protein [Rhodococcus sp. H36-A4]|uniref:DoxX family protein n=1 Tax=Rhodococcus sp. H36-A4 TaxID=3004353 RepID=UPI0022AF4583|nr:DoxX family membrane protein [Rhodococcus sp. H36-A4]MCZ4080104.1 DoxX family membrane protein [Rhodococcus sp. H36-A4]
MKTIARILLGSFLMFAGLSHLFWAREAFRAQVPSWVPLDADFVVLASGVVEIALGLALVVLVRRRVALGWIVATFFVAVFPGNISQFLTHSDAFGLDTDAARGIRLLLQPVLVAWALWCTGAWAAWRSRRSGARVR